MHQTLSWSTQLCEGQDRQVSCPHGTTSDSRAGWQADQYIHKGGNCQTSVLQRINIGWCGNRWQGGQNFSLGGWRGFLRGSTLSWDAKGPSQLERRGGWLPGKWRLMSVHFSNSSRSCRNTNWPRELLTTLPNTALGLFGSPALVLNLWL